jgi:hypothetical protein
MTLHQFQQSVHTLMQSTDAGNISFFFLLFILRRFLGPHPGALPVL